MNIKEWPEGATHRIEGVYTKWVGEDEYSWMSKEWQIQRSSFCLSYYVDVHGFEIIERPADTPYVPKVGEDSLLPVVGETVGIKLASMGEEIIPHVVTGYKVWSALESSDAYHRVFILLGQSEDSRSGNNERLLKDIYKIGTDREELIHIILGVGNLSEGVLADTILSAGFTNKP